MKLILLALVAIQLSLINGMSMATAPMRTDCRYGLCKSPGGCVKMGKTWEQDCFKYRCAKGPDGGAQPKIVKKGCPWQDGSCKRVGYKKSAGCDMYQCIKTKGTNVYGFQIVKSKPGCLGEDGKCTKVGYRKRMGCDYYKCMENKSSKPQYYLEMVKSRRGCSIEGKCVRPGKDIKFSGGRFCTCSKDLEVYCAMP